MNLITTSLVIDTLVMTGSGMIVFIINPALVDQSGKLENVLVTNKLLNL